MNESAAGAANGQTIVHYSFRRAFETNAFHQFPQMQIDGVRVLVAPSDEASARRLLAATDDLAEPDGGS